MLAAVLVSILLLGISFFFIYNGYKGNDYKIKIDTSTMTKEQGIIVRIIAGLILVAFVFLTIKHNNSEGLSRSLIIFGSVIVGITLYRYFIKRRK